jgi:hypothetical protein
MTNLGDRPPVKAGLSIVGNEMEIHHALNDKENQKLKNLYDEDMFRPPDQFPTYQELMKHSSLPSKIEIHKKK